MLRSDAGDLLGKVLVLDRCKARFSREPGLKTRPGRVNALARRLMLREGRDEGRGGNPVHRVGAHVRTELSQPIGQHALVLLPCAYSP